LGGKKSENENVRGKKSPFRGQGTSPPVARNSVTKSGREFEGECQCHAGRDRGEVEARRNKGTAILSDKMEMRMNNHDFMRINCWTVGLGGERYRDEGETFYSAIKKEKGKTKKEH